MPESIETDRFLRLLPSYRQELPDKPWELFGSAQLWFVRCGLEPNVNATWKLLEATLPAADTRRRSQLAVLTVSPDGRVRRSVPTAVESTDVAPWSIDFQLPETVRLGEEMVVDVTLASQQALNGLNCSQVSEPGQ